MRLERIAVEKPEVIRVEAWDGDSFSIRLKIGIPCCGKKNCRRQTVKI